MPKMKQRFKQRKPLLEQITLQQAWDRISVELRRRDEFCLFVDRTYDTSNRTRRYKMYNAGLEHVPFLRESEVNPYGKDERIQS